MNMEKLMLANSEKSERIYGSAKELIPGGVNSPVRAIKPYPFYVESAKGSRIYDVDGNEFIDCCLAHGPEILGHNHPEIRKAIEGQLAKGWIYGAPVESEVKLAEKIAASYKSIDMARFVSTGTEATMSAIRLARGYTGKDGFLKIEGGFHGAHDAVLVKAGSGVSTHGEASSAGIPAAFTRYTFQAPFNDIESMAEIIEKRKDELAALIVEPVMGNAGPVPPEPGYLQELRKLTEENEVLLVFDEVITGFRLAMGGASEYFGVDPDLVTLGKIVGGGLPIGVFGGKREIMEMVSPTGPVYQAGTFSGHPCSVAAGNAMLELLKKEKVQEKLNRTGDKFRSDLAEIVEDKKPEYSVSGVGSLFKVFFGKKPRNYRDTLACDQDGYVKFFHRLLKSGVFVPPSQFETNFISSAHSGEDLEKVLEAYKESL
ncbi:MAG: glutamate-1-semialdehyde 2,1-aminomutase [Methanosarcinaceae archaeon]|nr:glutamate-1-semialdehyde 2,1-aminomutase [Methanosarcinaceae archaeon]